MGSMVRLAPSLHAGAITADLTHKPSSVAVTQSLLVHLPPPNGQAINTLMILEATPEQKKSLFFSFSFVKPKINTRMIMRNPAAVTGSELFYSRYVPTTVR